MDTKLHLRVLLIVTIIAASLISGKAQAEANTLESLMELSLEELDDVEVTSVSRKPESRFKAAAAVSVLTAEDIRRSGVTNIAEALRLVPGMNVAKIDANKWAISARGFNRMFSNKLLVQIDGRSVYTPLVSGVYWDIQDLILADIDRIEVIRGPGATLWGSNAVNGIINIITKSSEFTKGTHLKALYGNHERGTLSARYGGEISDNLHYRVYGKYKNVDETTTVADGIGTDDDWYMSRAGFRADWNPSLHDKVRFHGEFHSGRENQVYALPGLDVLGADTLVEADDNITGSYILGSWTRSKGDSEHILQAYVDFVERDVSVVLDQDRITFDIDYQNRFKLNARNELVWGLGYRFFRDNLNDVESNNGITYLNYEPEKSYNNLFSAFVQNEFAVVPEKLDLIIGSKFEHNYFTDFEIQPSARLAWYPSDNQTLWASVSRAVRIPTRSERSFSSVFTSTPGGFIRLSADGEQNFESENVIAFETGYRVQPFKWASLDVSGFYNKYNDLRTFEPGVSGFNNPNTVAEFIARNLGEAETYGIELESQFSVTKDWKLFVNYSFLEMATHIESSSVDTSLADKEGQVAENQLSVTSRYNLTNNIEVDSNFFFVDNLPALDIPSHARFDARIGWKPMPNVDISLIGQDLIGGKHQEFNPGVYSRAAEIDKSVYLQLTIDF